MFDVYADILFTGGSIYSPSRRGATAVAVTGNRISAVGGVEVHDLRGPDTEVIPLRGRLLAPGFQDAHVHPLPAALEAGQCDLTNATTRAAALEIVAAYAHAHPRDEWVVGGGWSMQSFPNGLPNRADLDQIVSDRPVYLINCDHHGAWVNTRALELAGVTRDTPDPPDGRIDRDAAGFPSGSLQEGAMQLVGRLVPPPTASDQFAALLRAQRHLHSLGITAWQDALVGDYLGMADPTESYRRAIADNALSARVVGALWWDRERGLEQLPELLSRRDVLGGNRFGANTVKIMLDGIAETATAAMIEPYKNRCGCGGVDRGTSFIDSVDLASYVTALDKVGFQCHFHALGDRAVRDALDAIEAARAANGPSDTRPHLAHVQVIHPADVGRFNGLGASANIQPLWAAHEPQMDDLTIPLLGAERAGWQYPFRDLLDAGARLAAGSDWPVSSPNPLHGIHVAVNRIAPGSTRPAFLPHQKLTVTEAFDAYTSGSAYVNHLDETGTIREGALADIVVLDRNPLAEPVEELAQVGVDMTYVDGVRVFVSETA